jgi:phosphate/sulfate permease
VEAFWEWFLKIAASVVASVIAALLFAFIKALISKMKDRKKRAFFQDIVIAAEQRFNEKGVGRTKKLPWANEAAERKYPKMPEYERKHRIETACFNVSERVKSQAKHSIEGLGRAITKPKRMNRAEKNAAKNAKKRRKQSKQPEHTEHKPIKKNNDTGYGI